MDRTTLTTSENTSDTNTYNAYNAWDNLSDKYYFDATYSNELTESVLLVPSNLEKAAQPIIDFITIKEIKPEITYCTRIKLHCRDKDNYSLWHTKYLYITERMLQLFIKIIQDKKIICDYSFIEIDNEHKENLWYSPNNAIMDSEEEIIEFLEDAKEEMNTSNLNKSNKSEVNDKPYNDWEKDLVKKANEVKQKAINKSTKKKTNKELFGI